MTGSAQRSDFVHRALDIADGIDAALYGKRSIVLIVLSFITVALSTWETLSTPRDLRWTAIGTLLLAIYIEVLLLARIGSFRDDAKRWSATLVGERLKAWWEDVGESMKASQAMPGSVRLRAVGRFIIGVAVVVLALRNVVILTQVILSQLFSLRSPTLASFNSGVLWAGGVTFLIGLILWALGVQLAKTGRNANALEVHDSQRLALAHAAATMPPEILDCSNGAAIRAFAQAAPHALLRELLDALAAWRPRSHANEAGYALSLSRKLRERMPSASAERERPPHDGKQRFRADLVIGDAVMIEMKRGLNASSAQKALGQVQMYAHAWGQKGPILLLICGAELAVVHRLLGPHLVMLRNHGIVVATVGLLCLLKASFSASA